MGYAMTLVNFRNGRREPIPRNAIVSVLERHGCRTPQLREGGNEIGLPRDEAGCSPFGEDALLAVKHGEVTEFGLNRPQATAECRALLYSLINDVRLTMFPDYGADIFARADVLDDIPQDILKQFSNHVVVTRPEDCI
jgi:hypothetical protein